MPHSNNNNADKPGRLRVLPRFRDDALRAQFGSDLTHKELTDALLLHNQEKRDAQRRIEFGPGWEVATHDELVAELARRTSERAGESILRALEVDDEL